MDSFTSAMITSGLAYCRVD